MPYEGVRNGYAELGIERYYEKHSSNYKNPHESIIKKLIEIAKINKIIGNKVIDLCCGSGEVTLALNDCEVIGIDPYTSEAYYNRTGREAIALSFKDIAEGELKGEYDCIICSFALHLCPKSLLPLVLWRLGEVANTLVIITPHKRPECDGIYGWTLVDEVLLDRIRMKVYCK